MGHFVFGQTVNTLSQKEKRQGWELLFDGKSTVGWHSFKKSGISFPFMFKNDLPPFKIDKNDFLISLFINVEFLTISF
jgi:hypothetical protein